MNVYVAGSIHDVQRVQEVQRIFKENGHGITFDWTAFPTIASWNKHPEDARKLAASMRVGVQTASLLVVVHPPRAVKDTDGTYRFVRPQGTWIEFGIALGQATPIWIIDAPTGGGPFLYSSRVVRFGMDELHERVHVG